MCRKHENLLEERRSRAGVNVWRGTSDEPAGDRDGAGLIVDVEAGIRMTCGAPYFNCLGANMPETDVKTKVLIADDERVIADTLVAILNHGGFDARAAYSCSEALEIARVFNPDLLISDVIMAEINGIETAVRMKRMLPGIHVFLLSGQTATSELLEKEKADGYGFEVLIKPVHPRDLITRLRECIAA